MKNAFIMYNWFVSTWFQRIVRFLKHFLWFIFVSKCLIHENILKGYFWFDKANTHNLFLHVFSSLKTVPDECRSTPPQSLNKPTTVCRTPRQQTLYKCPECSRLYSQPNHSLLQHECRLIPLSYANSSPGGEARSTKAQVKLIATHQLSKHQLPSD